VKIIRVESCAGCPFVFYKSTSRKFTCGHDESYGKDAYMAHIPSWCPLKDEEADDDRC
jgi:hypothetical protein